MNESIYLQHVNPSQHELLLQAGFHRLREVMTLGGKDTLTEPPGWEVWYMPFPDGPIKGFTPKKVVEWCLKNAVAKQIWCNGEMWGATPD